MVYHTPFICTQKAHCVKLSAIKQKSESQNGCYKKTKHDKFSKKCTFLIF